MQVACFIFIQRRWVDDKKHMENMLDYFCDIREPLQLLLFPEGTDLTGERKTMQHPSMGLTDHILVASQSSLRCLFHTFVLVLLGKPSDRALAHVLAYTSHTHFCENALIFQSMHQRRRCKAPSDPH